VNGTGILRKLLRMKEVHFIAGQEMLPPVVEKFYQLIDTLGDG
jgi:hypothetical protein